MEAARDALDRLAPLEPVSDEAMADAIAQRDESAHAFAETEDNLREAQGSFSSWAEQSSPSGTARPASRSNGCARRTKNSSSISKVTAFWQRF
jgi:hypothetical protein